MARDPMKEFPRAWREENVRRNIENARGELAWTYNCDSQAVYALVRANRALAHARSTLVYIGPHDSPRTRKYWRIVSKVEQQVNQAGNRVAKCLLR